ncbi:metallophosphoesterase family protein [Thermocoleostomius sinensis]|uniref:Metallophosphoesterase n=1 Tax=Thermocoleostomius sinensis A174 TaxID=2016057 RepID=A0A9E8ZHZ2_9CYAN|nr:metallophosphoesterase [Thermocoleostomius sinensis]WAL61560.1 metallophosphoesterase [Thermocoleostomius sinensis A174]
MDLQFRFAIVSDPHIALPHTIWHHPSRFHLVEISIPALEVVFEELAQFDLDFLLLPGDLTQHGEPENHQWLADRLAQLPYPAYVIPGNHDVVEQFATDRSIGLLEFPSYYQKFGYEVLEQPYYTCQVLPGVQLIGLNSNHFDAAGKQIGMGYIDETQMAWLRQVLTQTSEAVVLVMVHHNVIEHLPNQSQNPMGRRYMLKNAAELLALLDEAGVQLLFTGHLHVQDVAQHQNIYEITTGSLVSYPHPYRVLEFQQIGDHRQLQIQSGRVTAVPGWTNLSQTSKEWMGDRSLPFMVRLLTEVPFNLPLAQAEQLAPALRYFWADIADGDACFHFPTFPPEVNQSFKYFSAIDQQGNPAPIDNFAILRL